MDFQLFGVHIKVDEALAGTVLPRPALHVRITWGSLKNQA